MMWMKLRSKYRPVPSNNDTLSCGCLLHGGKIEKSRFFEAICPVRIRLGKSGRLMPSPDQDYHKQSGSDLGIWDMAFSSTFGGPRLGQAGPISPIHFSPREHCHIIGNYFQHHTSDFPSTASPAEICTTGLITTGGVT